MADNTVTITVRMPAELRARIDDDRRNLAREAWAREAFELALSSEGRTARARIGHSGHSVVRNSSEARADVRPQPKKQAK